MRITSDDLGGLDVQLGYRVVQYLCQKCVPLLYPNRPARVLLSYFQKEIGFPFSEVEPALVGAGLITPLEDQDQPGTPYDFGPECYSLYYEISEKAWAIAKGNILKRMTRRELEALLGRAQERIEQVQQDDRFLYEFGFVAIIGSYMEEKPDYGDLDLVFWVHLKEKFRGQSERRLQRLHYTAWPGDHRILLPSWKMIVSARPRRYVKLASYKRIDVTPFDDFAVLRSRNPDMLFKVLIGDVLTTVREWREADRTGELGLIDGGMRE